MATSGLDLNAYFAAKRAAVTPDKLTALADASESKTAALLQRRLEAEQTRNRIAVQEAASANSWAGRLGLEPESFTGNRVNDVASLVSGASRLAGHVTSLPVNALAMANTAGMPQEAYDSYNRSIVGTPLEGDTALLNRREPNGLSVKEKFENAATLRGVSRDINNTTDLTKIVDPTNRNNLNNDLGDSFDVNWGKVTSGNVMDTLTGLGGLAADTGKALVTNPSAVREYVLENAPQLLVGALGKAGQATMAASNAGYAADTYSQGIEAYAKKNGGQLPPEEQRERMSLQAAALALAEQGGDMAGLALAGLKKKAAAELVKTSFKESLKNVAKAGTGAFATEAITEGIQTHLEGEIIGKPASAKDIYIAGAIGGASGSTLSGGVRTLAEMSGATAEHAAVRKQTVIDKEVLEAAADKGDVTSYMDKASPNYSPGKAVEVLFKHSQKEDTTPEQREANTAKADEIVAGLEAERASAERNLALSTVAGSKKAISDYEMRLSEMGPNDPERSGVLAAIEVYQGNVADKEAKGENPVAVKANREKLAQLDSQLEQANKNAAALSTLNKSNDDVASLVSIADTAIETVASGEQDAPAVASAPRAEATESVNKVITLAMKSPEKVSDAQARQLADNPKNGLTEAQRTFLRAFSEERVAANVLKTMDGVAIEVAKGGNGNIGMAQHRTALRAALAAGNQEVAAKTVGMLERFAQSHSGKATALIAAKKGDQVLKNQATGEWFVAAPEQRLGQGKSWEEADALVAKNGGFTKNSLEAVETIKAEANALVKMVNAAKAAYALKFETSKPATPTTTGVENVPNTPQRVPAQDGQSEAKATETTKAAEPAGNQGTVVPGDAKPADVETAGVVAAKEAPASSVVAETAKETESSKTSEVTQETEKTEVNSTSDEETELNTETVLIKEAGVLSALANKSPEGTPYNLRNLLADFFTQASSKQGDTTQRPLASVANFMTALGNGTTTAADWLTNKTETVEQTRAIDGFMAYANSVVAGIVKSLPPKKANQQYRLDDMMQFMLTSEGDVADMDENIKTAITYATYKRVLEMAGTSAILLPKQINSILKRQKGVPVSSFAYANLGKAGIYQHLLVDSLGGDVLDALGLSAKSTAPQELIAKLRIALGSHALKVMEDSGMVKRTRIQGHVIREMREEGLSEKQVNKLRLAAIEGMSEEQAQRAYETNDLIYHEFFALSRDRELKYMPKVQAVVDANKGSQDILGKLFKVESGVKIPSLAPITAVQATTAGTSMGIPEEQAAVILKNQAQPWRVRKDSLLVLDVFSVEERLTMMGVVEENDATTHVDNHRVVEAKNAALRREYELFTEYVGEYLATGPAGLDTSFYLPYSVWKQQRVGIDSTVVNPQASKIVRYLVAMPEWETVVSMDDADMMASFYLRVAEGLGVKTERKDNDISVADVQTTLALPVYADAVSALHKQAVKKEALTADEKASILGAVAKGGEKLHSFNVLLALAYHKEAVDTKAKEFTTYITGEVDGVANGTMLNHMLLGAAGSAAELNAIGNQGGFYEAGHAHTEYNQWRGDLNNKDIYESTAVKVIQKIASLLQLQPDADGRKTNAELVSIWAISGQMFNPETGAVTKDGRSLVKNAMNPLAFGSSIDSISVGMSATFLASVRAGFEKLAKQKPSATQVDVDAYATHLNVLIGKQGDHLPMGRSLLSHMQAPLGKHTERALMNTFSNTVGFATTSVLEETFAVFLRRRDSLNKTAQTTFGLYDAVRSGMREAYIEELISEGKLEAVGENGRMGDLSKKQEAELDKRLEGIKPVMRTAMSKNDKTSRDGTKGRRSGMLMAKVKRKQNKDSTYANRTGFGQKLKNNKNSVTLHGFSNQSESMGVAAGSAQTHSTDSAIMIWLQAKEAVLGVHDAYIAGLNGLKRQSEAINGNTWNALLEHSPLSEVYDSLATVVYGISKMVDDGSLSPQAMDNLKTYLSANAFKYGIKPWKSVDQFLQMAMIQAHEEAYLANKVKLETMVTWAAISQYSYQGGNYQVTGANLARAAVLLEENTRVLPEGDAAAIANLKTALKQKTEKAQTTAVAKKEQIQETATDTEDVDTSLDSVNDQAANTVDDENDFEGYDLSGLKETTTTPFGELGKPTAVSDPDLVTFFNEHPKANAKQVIDHLYRKLSAKDSGGNRDFNLKLLKMLSKTVNPSLTINLVTKDTSEDDVLGIPQSPAFGWYSNHGTEEAIYLAGNDFTHSNIRVEVLLHELTHAATLYRLTTAAGKPYRAELEQLLSATKKHLDSVGVTKYAAALTSVDELVAYGMTSKDFQQNVLAKVPMGFGNVLTTALKKFVDILAGLLGFTDVAAANGLGVLLSNVTALMEQSATERVAVGSRTLSMASPIEAYTTLDLHNALDNNGVTPAFNEHLTGLLRGMVESLHGPFGAFKESFMGKQAGTALEVWAKAKVTGIAPFASQALLSGFPASQQEAFAMEQVEATVAAALSSRDASTKAAYKELYELYSEAYKTFKPSDFASQADYDFVFKIEQSNGGVSNYLSRFAALGLANQKFNSMLKISSSTADRVVKTSDSFAERLQLAFQKILAMFNRKVLHIYAGQPMDEKLGHLVEQLVDIEAKRKATLGDITWDVQLMNPMAKTAHQLTEAAKAGIAKAGSSAFVQGSRLQAVKAVGNLATILTTKGRTKSFLLAFRDMRDKYTNERMGVMSSLMQEYVGQDDKNQVLLRASKLNDGHRKDVISGFGKSVKEGFKDDGKAMTEESRNSITPVFLRTGAHHLVDHFSLIEIAAMLKNPADLQAAITKIENQLASVPLAIRADYIEKANALGMFKATGRNLDPHLLKNAYSISKMYGTATQTKISDQQAEQAQPVIAALVALYALEYTNEEQLKHAHEVLQVENQRTDQENGVGFVLAIHKDMEKESLARLFKGNPALMTHGYTPEIYDPFVTLTTANAVDGAKLEAQGYKKGAALSVDPADPDTSQRSLYVLQGLGMTRRLTGAMAFQGKQAKGSPIHSGFTNTATTSGTNNANTNAGIAGHRAQLGKRSPTRSRVDLSKAKNINYMAPVIDEQGNVITWAYLMQETTKDSLLRRDNRFDKVIGTLAGSILGKESGAEQNDKVIVALKEQFDLDTKKSLDSYFLVGPKTKDPERKEIWNLLPYETKQTILKVWGEEGMLVRKDAMDIIFGYRKLSLTDAFNKDPVLRDAFDRVVVAIARAVFGEKAALRLAQGERGWQDIVAEAKDLIVVKTGVVMLSNIKSNMWLLAMSGVPIKEILYHHLVALKGSHSYRKDSEELAQLQRLQATGYTQGKDVQIARDIARLEDALARNPIKELMDAGLMPTIVDDINPDDDIYSYKSGMAKAIDNKLKKVSPLVINAAKTIYMAHDTKLYQGLHRITQLSDFVARYTMYQHLTNQKVKPLTKEEAIQEASDAFINYDIPMHRKMQYLDDMGIMMFTKYFLRVQKVLVKNLRDNPGRVIGSILMANYLGLGETVHQEASMWGRIGNNPFGVGAGNYFSSLDDLATISGPMALIK